MIQDNQTKDFRVVTNTFEPGDRAWMDKCQEIYDWCQENVQGTITSVPGEYPGQVCWIFDNADAAFWFTVRWVS